MLKAGQRMKRASDPFEVSALGVEDYPPRFIVASAFADKLQPGDKIFFIPQKKEISPLWDKIWRIANIEKHTEDTRKIFVIGAS